MNYYIFDRVPGYHPKYTFAVLAVSSHDARQWMRNVNKGGTLVQAITRAGLGVGQPDRHTITTDKDAVRAW